jgi:hypothetical protein
MFCAVSATRDICERYGVSYRADISGNLIFDYNSGMSERFGKDGHLIPISAGFWCSRMVDLNIIREVFICISMPGVSIGRMNYSLSPSVPAIIILGRYLSYWGK